MTAGWNKKRDLLVSIFIAELAGVVGSVYTASSIPAWYTGLEKPWWTPPNWIFGPVWVALYALMGFSAYLVWEVRHRKKEAEGALLFYGVHLFFNSLWSLIFFGLQNVGLALVEIFFLWLLIIYTMILFFRVERTAGWVFVPYLIWVSFAMMLNYSLVSAQLCNSSPLFNCLSPLLGIK